MNKNKSKNPNNMYHVHIQYAGDKALAPKSSALRKWAKCALQSEAKNVALTIRIVDVDEMTDLNETYRKKKGATNVLSFPFEMPEHISLDRLQLGDIVICSEIVNREALEQHKNNHAHWAHMVVHGVFHLLGHDHENDAEAKQMEALEIAVLKQLGIANPYAMTNE